MMSIYIIFVLRLFFNIFILYIFDIILLNNKERIFIDNVYYNVCLCEL